MTSSRFTWYKTLQTAVLATLIAAALAPNAAYAEESAPAVAEKFGLEAKEYREYLQDRYDIGVSPSPTKGEFINHIARILKLEPKHSNSVTDLKHDSPYYRASNALYESGVITDPNVQAEQPLTKLGAVFLSLKAANLKELAYTYPESKIRSALLKIHAERDDYELQAAQELAAAVDTGLLPAELQDSFRPAEEASGDFAAILLGKIISFHGDDKHYVARVQDDTVFSRVYQAFRAADLIQPEELKSIFDTALKDNLITGYNLKDSRYNPNFDPELSLTYGHDDITHALQLIGLLRSEGLNAKVQVEPKTSAYIYLKEWGDPVQTDNFHVVRIENGNYIAYAKEYDISFEFDTVDQKAQFNSIIHQYAKKNAEDQPGLIYSSWWQPLYYSLTEQTDYKVIANNKVANGSYYAQSFSLENKAAEIAAGLNKIAPKVKIESYKFWVDEPFYNYLLGGYK
ncbi:hypothetical protein [Paenibacillus hamazuiensis]|uniref:hypothetical protein n=1 Tax=Paenibacillus hamazuiensis TaxID=2936508 RepID=UPI00200D3D86|nr:hypothetical protein [Paenibacillus hamazuiensis]